MARKARTPFTPLSTPRTAPKVVSTRSGSGGRVSLVADPPPLLQLATIRATQTGTNERRRDMAIPLQPPTNSTPVSRNGSGSGRELHRRQHGRDHRTDIG